MRFAQAVVEVIDAQVQCLHRLELPAPTFNPQVRSGLSEGVPNTLYPRLLWSKTKWSSFREGARYPAPYEVRTLKLSESRWAKEIFGVRWNP